MIQGSTLKLGLYHFLKWSSKISIFFLPKVSLHKCVYYDHFIIYPEIFLQKGPERHHTWR